MNIENAINANSNYASLVAGDYWPQNNFATISACYWPHYSYCAPDNKTEKAYQVIRALMKAKVIKVDSLEKFFEAMDATIEAL